MVTIETTEIVTNLSFSPSKFQEAQEAPHQICRSCTAISPPKMGKNKLILKQHNQTVQPIPNSINNKVFIQQLTGR